MADVHAAAASALAKTLHMTCVGLTHIYVYYYFCSRSTCNFINFAHDVCWSGPLAHWQHTSLHSVGMASCTPTHVVRERTALQWLRVGQAAP